jgi:UDP-glucose 4-epimerase
MKTLVTGGFGFIGSHLVEALLTGGHHVTVIDDFSTGTSNNLMHLADHNSLHVVDDDVTYTWKIEKYFKDVDWVFHLAALADIVPSITNPRRYHTANVEGTLSVLECAKTHNVKRFIYTASSSCYGLPVQYPTHETARFSPCYPYALTKLVGELYVHHWGEVYGMSNASLRLFNVYGPRARTTGAYGAVFGVFLAQKLAGKPFTIVGDGTQTRDFVYVTDVVSALLKAAESSYKGVLNVGTGNPQSILRMVELLGGGERVFIPDRPGEPRCTQANISLIRQVLQWEPQVSFETGVGLMLENIKHWIGAPVWTPESIENATRDWFKYLGKTK